MSNPTFGKYVTTQLLGRGGMADVYRARHPALGRDVAIKVIHPHLAAEPGFVDRFCREAKLVASLRHQHIVQLYDFDVVDGQPFMVMEYLEGGTLKGRLADLRSRGRLMSMDEIVRLLEPIASALDYAHAQNAIHRDLKPANILFTAHGEPVLTDFGIAKLLDESVQFSASGTLVGTPAYMSPEQAASKAVDARSDLYSLGIVLYEMVTGRVPFQGESPTAVMMQHLTAPPPDPCHFNPDLPGPMRDVILQALAKEPDRRHAGAAELVRAWNEARQSQAAGESTVGGESLSDALTVREESVKPSAAGPTFVPAPVEKPLAPTVRRVRKRQSSSPPASPTDRIDVESSAGTALARRSIQVGSQEAGTIDVPREPAASETCPPSPVEGLKASTKGPQTRLLGLEFSVLALGCMVVLACGLGIAGLVAAKSQGWIPNLALVSTAAPTSTATLTAMPMMIATATTTTPPITWIPPTYSTVVRPTFVSTATATPRPITACPSSKGTLYDFFDFASPRDWPTVMQTADLDNYYAIGGYHINVLHKNWYWATSVMPTNLGTRYAIELHARQISGPNDSSYGIFFVVVDDANFLEFRIRESGTYRVAKSVADKSQDLVGWTKTPWVKKGDLNGLGVKVEGTRLTVCLNGNVLTALEDSALKLGRIGIIAGAADEPTLVRFEDLAFWKLE